MFVCQQKLLSSFVINYQCSVIKLLINTLAREKVDQNGFKREKCWANFLLSSHIFFSKMC